MEEADLQKSIRLWLGIFMAGLVVSGLTAVALPAGTDILRDIFGSATTWGQSCPALSAWIELIHKGVHETQSRYPFILYGTDWLAFGHIAIAIVFLGPFRDPIKNVWVIRFGMIACSLVIPWAFIFGSIRGIPFWWQLIDTSFGILGLIPLWFAYKYARRLGA